MVFSALAIVVLTSGTIVSMAFITSNNSVDEGMEGKDKNLAADDVSDPHWGSWSNPTDCIGSCDEVGVVMKYSNRICINGKEEGSCQGKGVKATQCACKRCVGKPKPSLNSV